MKIKRLTPVEYDIKYLRATMGVRYYVNCEYTEDNGKTWHKDFEDTDEADELVKSVIPGIVKKDIGYKESEYFEIIIDLDKGKVINWPKNFTLITYFKICDDGEYVFLDKKMNEIVNITKEYDQYYVPSFLSIDDNGYGDYLYITILGGGKIHNFDIMKTRIEEYFTNL